MTKPVSLVTLALLSLVSLVLREKCSVFLILLRNVWTVLLSLDFTTTSLLTAKNALRFVEMELSFIPRNAMMEEVYQRMGKHALTF